jgi:adenylylsulfate kinase-like enzyme
VVRNLDGDLLRVGLNAGVDFSTKTNRKELAQYLTLMKKLRVSSTSP